MNLPSWTSRFQFTLAGFLRSIVILYIGFAAIIRYSSWMAGWSRVAYLVLLGIAAVGSLVRTGTARIFWIACFVFGLGYIWAADADPLPVQNLTVTAVNTLVYPYSYPPYGYYPGNSQNGDHNRTRLPTSRMLDWLAAHRSGRHQVGDHVQALWRGSSYFPATLAEEKDGQFLARWDDGDVPLWVGPTQIAGSVSESHYRIGHAVIGILIALSAGWFCSCLFGEAKDESSFLAA